jgi:hypothetical protein
MGRDAVDAVVQAMECGVEWRPQRSGGNAAAGSAGQEAQKGGEFRVFAPTRQPRLNRGSPIIVAQANASRTP